ncbi:MAG: hypothetical protein J0M08_07610 [Bacteroidetes bacterium]|nr:hypothetical protein [Bacteroidota bacterium]
MRRYKTYKLIAFFIVITNILHSQTSIAEEFSFVRYLLSNNLLEDANYVLKKCKTTYPEISSTTVDSIDFIIASNYHKSKKFDSCIVYLKNISSPSLKTKSALLLSYSYLFTGKRMLGDSIVHSIKVDTTDDMNHFINYQKAASALLNRNWRSFDSISSRFGEKDYRLAKEEKDILMYYVDLKKIKRKSPFVAGLLSAVIPGSGKMYAGYSGKALSSFMPNLIFATATAESIYRDGLNTPQTYIFGSLFTTFYLGSIVGSAYSVKLKRADKYKEIDNEILFDIYNSYNRYK